MREAERAATRFHIRVRSQRRKELRQRAAKRERESESIAIGDKTTPGRPSCAFAHAREFSGHFEVEEWKIARRTKTRPPPLADYSQFRSDTLRDGGWWWRGGRGVGAGGLGTRSAQDRRSGRDDPVYAPPFNGKEIGCPLSPPSTPKTFAQSCRGRCTRHFGGFA